MCIRYIYKIQYSNSLVQYRIVQHSDSQLYQYSISIIMSISINISIVQQSIGQYSIIQYSIVQYSIVQYSIVQYSIVQYSIVQYQYSIVQYGIVQYSISIVLFIPFFVAARVYFLMSLHPLNRGSTKHVLHMFSINLQNSIGHLKISESTTQIKLSLRSVLPLF